MYAGCSAGARLLSIRTDRMERCRLTAGELTELGSRQLGVSRGELQVSGHLAGNSLRPFRASSLKVSRADCWSSDRAEGVRG